MYTKKTYRFRDSREIEISHFGRYGAKGERRLPKKKATPEQIKKQNQKNRETRMRRLIKANFEDGDFWMTLKYRAGTRKPIEEVKKDLKKFVRAVRSVYARQKLEMKYIYRIEIGKEGGIHVHMVLNRVTDADRIISEMWRQGVVNFTRIRGDVKRLAEYIVKPPPEEMAGQLSLFDESERKDIVKYSTSRNLIRPAPDRREYKDRTVRRILENGPAPTKGFYIDADSVEIGINPVTGYPYVRYTELKLGRCADG